MPRTRKNHPPILKAKVAVEAIKAHRTTAQIAQMFGVHPTQVGGWKKQALAGLPDVFGKGREQIRQQADAEKDERKRQSIHTFSVRRESDSVEVWTNNSNGYGDIGGRARRPNG